MIELDLRVDDPSWSEASANLEQILQTALNAAFTVGGIEGEVNLLLTDDATMRTLNRDWRSKDIPTDVLSFPATEQDLPFLGDIAFGFGICSRDAKEKQIEMDQHLSHLVIHGYLHLIGHDHVHENDAEKMETLEARALASLGWPDPYTD